MLRYGVGRTGGRLQGISTLTVTRSHSARSPEPLGTDYIYAVGGEQIADWLRSSTESFLDRRLAFSEYEGPGGHLYAPMAPVVRFR